MKRIIIDLAHNEESYLTLQALKNGLIKDDLYIDQIYYDLDEFESHYCDDMDYFLQENFLLLVIRDKKSKCDALDISKPYLRLPDSRMFKHNGKKHRSPIQYVVVDHLLKKPKILEKLRLIEDAIPRGNYSIVDVVDGEAIQDMINYLNGIPYVFLDIESMGLNPIVPERKMLCIAVGDKDHQFIFDLQEEDAQHVIDLFIAVVVPLLPHRGVIQNAKFEKKWFKHKYGIEFDLAYDSMLLSYIAYSGGKHGIKDGVLFADSNFVGYDDVLELYIEDKSQMDQLPKDILFNYNALDIIATDLFFTYTFGEFEITADMWDFYSDVTMKMVDVLTDMELDGMMIDPDELIDTINWYKMKCDELSELLKKEPIVKKMITDRKAKDPKFEVNFRSYQQKSDLIYTYGKLKVPDHFKTDKGGKSANAEVFDYLIDKHPDLSWLKTYTTLVKADSLLSGQMFPYLKNMDDSGDNFVRSNFNMHVVATGRLSSSDPNVQNIPRSSDLAVWGLRPLKSYIRSRFKDGLILSADFSQVELRIAVIDAQDDMFMKAFLEGRDLHGQTAQDVFGDGWGDVERSKAKIINFSIINDISAYKLSNDLNTTEDEAQSYIDKFFMAHPKMRKKMDFYHDYVMNHGYTTTLTGRRRYFVEDIKRAKSTDSRREKIRLEAIMREAANHPVQGTAVDLTFYSLVEMRKEMKSRGLKSLLINTIHDSIVTDLVPEEAEEMIELQTTIMNNIGKKFEWCNLPIKADFSIGYDLNDMEKIK